MNATDALASVLLATEPRAELVEELAPFRPLIGSCDVTITWLGPARHVVFPFIGRLADGRILLDGEFQPGLRTRWLFADITPTSFRWENLDSTDDGTTWTLRQDMAATRTA